MSHGVRRARDQAGFEPGGARALVLVFAGLAAASMLLPFGVVGLAFEIAAIVVGVRALRRARAAGRRAPGALAAVVAGSAATLVLLGMLAFVALFYEEYRAYETCLGRALTEAAKGECRDTFEREIGPRLRVGG